MVDASIGQKAPDFELPDQEGIPWNLSGQLITGPVVLIFYRGNWAPYCNGQLVAFAREYEKFERRGVQVAAISVDPPEANAEMGGKLLLPFPVLSDARGDLCRILGLWDEKERLATPSIVMISKSMEIEYVYVGEDFSDRPENETVFAALDKLNSPVGGPVSDEPKIRLQAGEAARETVRPDRDAISLDQLFTYYEGTYFATVAIKKRLGGIGFGSSKAIRETERYQKMVTRHSEAIRRTLELRS